jgi:geranyl-CoA carboxylase alpha subunit
MLSRSFDSVLVANRGEIAVRVLNEARASGMRAIAVYSDADEAALHVREADEAVRIGPAPAAQSYLDINAILNAAQQTGAEAIHPGYGFLSENASFARAVIKAGLVWIGPPPEAIDAMGDKARAKALMIEAGVPTLPGWQGEDQSDASLKARADTVGYPLLIKAVAGGGGRGMRIVRDASDFDAALASARREAKSAFGDDAVLLERFIERGRHVEIQVFADSQGHVLHLGERDCSAQRRRQKVIEEAPSPAVDDALRARMGADAVAAAKAVDYVGAGTVEFLLDDEGGYYFLEMNTRLQVEHPVTEAITGTNLVQRQFAVAAGEPLPLTQDEITLTGHSIELRLYAEDPFNEFAPQSGRVLAYNPHGVTEGVRVDSGVDQFSVIGTDYDAMVAKLIAHAPTRAEAIAALREHMIEAPLMGVRTNRDFLIRLLDDAAFAAGEVRTADLDAWSEAGSGPFSPAEPPFEAIALAAADATATYDEVYRSPSVRCMALDLEVDGKAHSVSVEQLRGGGVRVLDGETPLEIVFDDAGFSRTSYTLNGEAREAHLVRLDDEAGYHIALGDRMVFVREASPWSDADASDASKILAPVSGAVVAVHVKPGDAVKAGDVVAVMEAMKMEMRLTAEADGTIAAVHAAEGGQASGGFVLIELDLQTQD